MSIKKVYEALETLENGSDLVDIVKGEIQGKADLEAGKRLFEKEKKALSEALEAEKTKLQKIADAGIDIENVDEIKTALTGKSEIEKSMITMQKQMKQLSDKLDASEKEKVQLENQRKAASLKADFGNTLNGIFGEKFGDTLIKTLIAEGSLKYDDAGKPIYETEKGVYSKEDAIEMLKGEYKDYIRSTDHGSGSPPPAGKGVPKGVDIMSLNETELFSMGRG